MLQTRDGMREFKAQDLQGLSAEALAKMAEQMLTRIGEQDKQLDQHHKTIAEQAGYRPPSFFGYMLYAGIILLPVYVLVTLLFFRPA